MKKYLTSKNKGFLFVLFAAFLWSTLGIVSRNLYGNGFNSLEVTSIRIISAALFLSPVLIKSFKTISALSAKQYILLGCYALTGILLFYWVEMESFKINPTGIAYVLLYTAPLILIICDRLFFGESLTPYKILSGIFILLGIVLITGILSSPLLSVEGIILAIGSAVFYASYSLWGKYFSKQLNSNLVVSFIFFLAGIMSISSFPLEKVAAVSSISLVFSIIYIGLFPTAIAYFFYNKSLNTITISEASVTATIEPVFAVLWGITLLDESISGLQSLGMILILLALVIIKLKE